MGIGDAVSEKLKDTRRSFPSRRAQSVPARAVTSRCRDSPGNRRWNGHSRPRGCWPYVSEEVPRHLALYRLERVLLELGAWPTPRHAMDIAIGLNPAVHPFSI